MSEDIFEAMKSEITKARRERDFYELQAKMWKRRAQRVVEIGDWRNWRGTRKSWRDAD